MSKERQVISMTQYVRFIIREPLSDREKLLSIIDYSLFLQSTIELKRFIPCKDGKLLEKPSIEEYRSTYDTAYYEYKWRIYYNKDMESYQQVEKDVWFEGWEYVEKVRHAYVENKELDSSIGLSYINFGHTIEQYISQGHKLTLTEHKAKELGLL